MMERGTESTVKYLLFDQRLLQRGWEVGIEVEW